jgi:thiol-disulfide isomerase/thioredoxin
MSGVEDRAGQGLSVVKRRWLLGGAALAAAAAGAGFAVWRLRPAKPVPEAVQALWRLNLPTPQGAPLALAELRGRPTLLNFWATWCPPCVEEIPLLDAFHRQNSPSSCQVLGIAIDQATSVQRFLARSPVSFPMVLGGLEGSELARSFGNESGGLPFSVLLGADGGIIDRKMGQLTPELLARWREAARA